MPDAFPETPVSLLACLEEQRGGMRYQDAWRAFFDLYHSPIRAAALSTFRKYNWPQVPESLLEEIIADVVVSFFKADFSYDPARGKFRNYLRQLTAWRIMDSLGKLPVVRPQQLDLVPEPQFQDTGEDRHPAEELEQKEHEAYRAALLSTMLEDVRTRVSPQTFLLFELTKIQGRSPDSVAIQFKVKRNVVDNAAYRVMAKLRELACQPEYRKEYV